MVYGDDSTRCPNGDNNDNCHKLRGGTTYVIRITSISGYSALRFQFDVHANNFESGDACEVYSRYDNTGTWSNDWSHTDTDDLFTGITVNLPLPAGHSSIEISIEVDGDGDSNGILDRCYFDNGRLQGILNSPTKPPTKSPTPTMIPTPSPTSFPTDSPITPGSPTKAPSDPTSSPTKNPTSNPSKHPTSSPSDIPTSSPTNNPTNQPIAASTTPSPTVKPTAITTTPSPTNVPTKSPSVSDQSTTASDDGVARTQSTWENIDFLALGVCCGIICCLILIIVIICKRSRSKSKKHKKKSSMELSRITSASTDIVNATKCSKSTNGGEPGEITLVSWLSKVSLMEYYTIFVDNGFGDGRLLRSYCSFRNI